MSLGRLTGSHDSVQRTGATRSSAAFAARRGAHAPMTNSILARVAREQKWPAGHEREPQEGAAGPPENHGAADACSGRPRFARLRAAIAERQLDWGWHNSFDSKRAQDESERSAAKSAETGLSARKLWVGGIAFALLAAALISAVASVQSGRLPFEAWARGDLMQLAGVVPGAVPPGPRVAHRVAGLRERALMVAPPAADRAGEEVDAALASQHQERADVEVAILGPILASAAAAARLAADLPVPTTAARAERLLFEPPRPLLKPTLVSSFQPESDATTRRRSRP
jgi:hypothetical protein